MFPDPSSQRRLTETELSQLAELERRLGEEDPELVRAFASGPVTRIPRVAALVYLAVSIALLLSAAVIGGFGGATAVTAALLLTAAVVFVPGHVRRRRTSPSA
jgi:hypothetical protein